jgi:hypothetical protein
LKVLIKALKMKLSIFSIFTLIYFFSFSQEETTPSTNEIGIDATAMVSTFGGNIAIGLKYGIVKNENLIFGPSVRFNRIWSHFNGIKTSFNIFGGGAFVHYRFQNIVFGAAELEFLRSPLNYNLALSVNRWVPVLLLGGGISRYFEVGIRINAGVYYDIVNSVNSPLQFSYQTRDALGRPIPVLYRVGFHLLI